VSSDVEHDVEAAARRIAAHGFSTADDRSWSVPDETFTALRGRVRGDRLEGLMLQAARDGAVALTDAQLAVVGAVHRQDMEQVLRLERVALDVVQELADRGVRAVVLKGVALANSIYRDPEIRSFADVDVLVEPGLFPAAVEVLVSRGAHRELPEVRPGFDARFAKDVPVSVDGMAVDLHRTLIQGPLGVRIPVAELVAASRPLQLGDGALNVLAPCDAYVVAALTAGAADVPARLLTLRDLLELERAPDFDDEAVRRAARRWGVEAAVARAIVVLDAVLRPDRPPALLPWARSFRPAALDRFYIRCYTGSARSYRSTLATLVAIERWSDRGRLAWAMLVPQRSYRQARGWSLGDHVRLGISRLRR
jgi:hypothetical protein